MDGKYPAILKAKKKPKAFFSQYYSGKNDLGFA